MKKKILLIIFFLLGIFSAKSSHIVGCDLSIEWVSQNNYRIKLRMYRDDVNASIGANIPLKQAVGIYDAVTNNLIYIDSLERTSIGLVHLGDACFTPDTSKVRIQEGIFESSSNIFIANNPNGYYIQSQVYARNSLANNIQNGGAMT